MKKYSIFYSEGERTYKNWSIESELGFMNVIKHFTSTMNIDSNKITSIHTEEIQKDSLVEFLDNNPAPKTAEKKELTKKEKELVWLSDFEAEQRYDDINNSFHL